MTETEMTATEAPAARKSGIGRWAILGLAAFFVALLMYGLLIAGEKRVEAGAAPDFTLTTFEGETLQLSDMAGQVVVVNFWSTWCVSCKGEAIDLEQAWQDFKDQGVAFVGVDYLDQEPLNLQWLEQYGITYPNGPDIQGRIYNAYGVQGLPETFVIDQQGNVAKVFVGPTTRAELSAEIRKLLDGEAG